MLRLARATIVLVAAALMGGAWPALAVADPECEISRITGQCVIVVDPGDQVTPIIHDGGPASGGGPSAPRTCTSSYLEGRPVECETSLGTWSQSRQCYVMTAAPQPPATDPVWAGRTEGAVYTCTGADRVGDIPVYNFWSLDPPADVDPLALAEAAVASMQLRAVDIATNPTDTSVVNLETWLWVDEPDGRTVGPLTRSASAGGVTVTATASMQRIVWDTGDGEQVVCDGPGIEWSADAPASACTHTYARASVSGAYTLAATSYWTVAWEGGGATGTIEFDLTSEAQLDVAEVQALVRS